MKFSSLNHQIKNMRTLLLIAFIVFSGILNAQKEMNMKLNAGFVTNKLKETKEFYTSVLNFGITFENEFYLLMHTPDHSAELSFLLPNHPSQSELFHTAYQGKGAYITIEVKDVNKVYEEMKAKNIEIALELKSEVWGDSHFAIIDPNGIPIDIVTYTKPEN